MRKAVLSLLKQDKMAKSFEIRFYSLNIWAKTTLYFFKSHVPKHEKGPMKNREETFQLLFGSCTKNVKMGRESPPLRRTADPALIAFIEFRFSVPFTSAVDVTNLPRDGWSKSLMASSEALSVGRSGKLLSNWWALLSLNKMAMIAAYDHRPSSVVVFMIF